MDPDEILADVNGVRNAVAAGALFIWIFWI